MGMKAMKAMKPAMKSAMKAMGKAIKAKKAMKVSKIAKGKRARAVVFAGSKEKTSGGMTKDQLVKSKTGRIVSKKASARAKKAYATSALKKARKQLNIKGFCACGGKTAQGKALYAKTKS